MEWKVKILPVSGPARSLQEPSKKVAALVLSWRAGVSR